MSKNLGYLEFGGNKYSVLAGANGIVVNKNAFYSVWNNKVTLDVVYKSGGNNQHSEDSRWYKKYKALEGKLTQLYGAKYCPEHCRFLGKNNSCDICEMEKE